MQPDELRKLGVDWVRANCESGSIRLAFLQQFDRAQQRACNVAFVFGHELTTRAKPHLVHFHAHEMFVFELTRTQEANQNVAADEMIGTEFLPRLEVAPAPAQLIEISDLVIDGHTQVDKSQPIRGRCSYSLFSPLPELLRSPPPASMPFPPTLPMPFPPQVPFHRRPSRPSHVPPSVSMYFPPQVPMHGQPPGPMQFAPLELMASHHIEPLAVQLSYELPGIGSCTVWAYPPGQLVPEGTLEFAFPPINSPKHSTAWVGTTAGFVRFCTAPNHNSATGGVPVSNTCGLLLDVVE